MAPTAARPSERMHCATASIMTARPCTRDQERQIAVPRINDRTSGVLVLMLLLSLVAADSTMAQTGTPAGYPSAPDPRALLSASIEEIAAILSTPVAELSDSATPFVPAAGSRRREDIRGSLCDVATALCLRQRRRPSADRNLYTDEFIRDFFGGVPREDLLDFLATPPQPLTDDQKRVIVRMGEVRLLPDGRLGVVIVLDEPNDPRSEEPDFVILERVEGRWLADEIDEDAGTTSTQPTGTQAAWDRSASNGFLSSPCALSRWRLPASR